MFHILSNFFTYVFIFVCILNARYCCCRWRHTEKQKKTNEKKNQTKQTNNRKKNTYHRTENSVSYTWLAFAWPVIL